MADLAFHALKFLIYLCRCLVSVHQTFNVLLSLQAYFLLLPLNQFLVIVE